MSEWIKSRKDILTAAGLFVIFYFIFFHNIGTYPLMDIDETRYVLMSKDMFHSKDFMTLYLNGEYFFEKPPLYFWLECISFKLFGFVNEFSARFPVSLCAMILSFSVYFTGKKIVSRTYGVLSSLILATSLEFTVLSKYAILDIVLCTFCALSVFSYFLTFYTQEKNKKYFWWLFYIFSALAVLAKGVPGFVIPFGTVFFVSLYTKTFKSVFKPVYLIPGVILFLIVTLPWHIIMLKTHPAFFHEYVVKHHLQRFVNSKELGRKQPWFYFLLTLLWGLVPWIFSVFAKIADCVKRFSVSDLKMPDDKQKLFIAMNIIAGMFTLVFFSSSSTKLMTYILPVYPFAAFVIGYIWLRYTENNSAEKQINFSVYLFSCICLVCAFAAVFMQYFLPEKIYADIKSIQWFSVFAIICTQIPAVLFIIKRNKKAVFACYVAFIMLLSAFGTPAFYRLDYKFGQNDLMCFAKYAKENNLKLYALNTGRRFSLNYYGESKNVFYVSSQDYTDLSDLKNKDSVIVLRQKEYDRHKYLFDGFKVINTGRKYIMLKPF